MLIPLKDVLRGTGRDIITITFVIISFLLLSFSGDRLPQSVKSFSNTFLYSFQKTVHNFLNFWDELRLENQKIKSLKEKAKRLRELEDENDILSAENEELRDQIEFEKSRRAIRPFVVLGADPERAVTTLIIDGGYREGILENDFAYVVRDGERVLIGKVIEVDARRSVIWTLPHNGISLSVRHERNAAMAVYEGNYPRSLDGTISFYPTDLRLDVGDRFFSSGLKPSPAGFLVGSVVLLSTRRNPFFQTAVIESPIKYPTLRELFIRKGSR